MVHNEDILWEGEKDIVRTQPNGEGAEGENWEVAHGVEAGKEMVDEVEGKPWFIENTRGLQ